MASFDESRADFLPYGFSCERWMPAQMGRADRHNEIEINFVEEGEIAYLFGGRRVTIGSGEIGMFWASIPHQIVDYVGTEPYFVLTVPLSTFLSYELPGESVHRLLRGDVIVGRRNPDSEFIGKSFHRWCEDFATGDAYRQRIALLEIEAGLHRLALNTLQGSFLTAAAGATDASGPDKVEQIAAFIARYLDEELSVERIAQHVGLHPNYTMVLFRRSTGFTLTQYINRQRVTQAQRLLVTSKESILDVALRSGFQSLSRFNKVFKEIAGCTLGPFDKATITRYRTQRHLGRSGNVPSDYFS